MVTERIEIGGVGGADWGTYILRVSTAVPVSHAEKLAHTVNVACCIHLVQPCCTLTLLQGRSELCFRKVGRNYAASFSLV